MTIFSLATRQGEVTCKRLGVHLKQLGEANSTQRLTRSGFQNVALPAWPRRPSLSCGTDQPSGAGAALTSLVTVPWVISGGCFSCCCSLPQGRREGPCGLVDRSVSTQEHRAECSILSFPARICTWNFERTQTCCRAGWRLSFAESGHQRCSPGRESWCVTRKSESQAAEAFLRTSQYLRGGTVNWGPTSERGRWEVEEDLVIIKN